MRIEEQWLPYAVNRYADALSSTWDTGDLRTTEEAMDSVQMQYTLDHVACARQPLGEMLMASQK